MMNPRSFLYVPGDQPQMLSKAGTRGADALIIDLEDAVAPDSKAYAREVVRAHLEQCPAERESGPQQWVRINPADTGIDDIKGVWHPNLSGIMVAKVEDVSALEEIDAVLTSLEASSEGSTGATRVVPLLESAAGVAKAAEIARHKRVVRLQVGEADLASELGITSGGRDLVLQSVRTALLLTSAAAGLEMPAAPVSTNFTDLDEFRAQTTLFAEMGFSGRACIHPRQVAIVNEVFTPTEEEIQNAARLVERFDEQLQAGHGVMLSDDGQMVDEAVVRRARRILERSQHSKQS